MRCDRSSDPDPHHAGSWHRLPWTRTPLEIPCSTPPSPALPSFSSNHEESQGIPPRSSDLPERSWHTQHRACTSDSSRSPGPPCDPSNSNHPDDNISWEGSGQRVRCFWTPLNHQGIPREKHSAWIPAKRTEFCCFYISQVQPVLGRG